MPSDSGHYSSGMERIVSRDDGAPNCLGCGEELTETAEDQYRCDQCGREFRWRSIYTDGGRTLHTDTEQ